MSNIRLSQPGGAGTLTVSGQIQAGVRCYLSPTGVSLGSWLLTARPVGSQSAVRLHPRLGWYFDPDVIVGSYTVQLTDSLANTYSATFNAAPARTIGLTIDLRTLGGVPNDPASGAVNAAAFASAVTLAAASGGGTVYLCAGQWYVDSALTISNTQCVCVQGDQPFYGGAYGTVPGTFLKPTSRFPVGATLLTLSGVRSCFVSRIGCDGYDETGTAAAANGIRLTATSGHQTTDVRVSDVATFQMLQGGSGSAASVTAFDGATSYATITGLTGMTSANVGRGLLMWNTATKGNFGDFIIGAFVSATSVKVYNPTGVAADANNGSIKWKVSNYGLLVGCSNDPADPNANIQCDTIAVDHLMCDSTTIGFKQIGEQTVDVALRNSQFFVPDNSVGVYLEGGNHSMSGHTSFEINHSNSVAGIVIGGRALQFEGTNVYMEVANSTSASAIVGRDTDRNYPTMFVGLRILFHCGATPTGKLLSWKQNGPLVFQGCIFLPNDVGVDTGDVSFDAHDAAYVPTLIDNGCFYGQGITRTISSTATHFGVGVYGPIAGAFGTMAEITGTMLQFPVPTIHSADIAYAAGLPICGFYQEETSTQLALTNVDQKKAVAVASDANTATETTCLLLRLNHAGVRSVQQVTLGIADSGGAGFKLLRVPN